MIPLTLCTCCMSHFIYANHLATISIFRAIHKLFFLRMLTYAAHTFYHKVTVTTIYKVIHFWIFCSVFFQSDENAANDSCLIFPSTYENQNSVNNYLCNNCNSHKFKSIRYSLLKFGNLCINH